MGNLLLNGQTACTQTGTAAPVLASTVNLSNANLSNTTLFPTGHVIQTMSDFFDPGGSGVDITDTTDDYLGSNLQVVLTPTSTSNKLIVFLYIPDCWNNNASTRSIRTGFRYDTNGFTSSSLPDTHLGTRGWVSAFHHYFGATQSNLADMTINFVCAVPTTSQITIRPVFYGVGGTFTLCSNSTASASATVDHMDTMSFIVQEVQT